jgi:hypothetical protein
MKASKLLIKAARILEAKPAARVNGMCDAIYEASFKVGSPVTREHRNYIGYNRALDLLSDFRPAPCERPVDGIEAYWGIYFSTLPWKGRSYQEHAESAKVGRVMALLLAAAMLEAEGE